MSDDTFEINLIDEEGDKKTMSKEELVNQINKSIRENLEAILKEHKSQPKELSPEELDQRMRQGLKELVDTMESLAADEVKDPKKIADLLQKTKEVKGDYYTYYKPGEGKKMYPYPKKKEIEQNDQYPYHYPHAYGYPKGAYRYPRVLSREAEESEQGITYFSDDERLLLDLLGDSGGDFKKTPENLYRKELIRVGEWVDPRDSSVPFQVTMERMQEWVRHFNDGSKKVPIPLRHTMEPDKNTGWLKKLEIEGDKLYGVLEFTNDKIGKMVEEGTIQDVSLGIDPNYMDTKTGSKVGEIIDHVALTLAPHIKDLSAFEPIAAEFWQGKVLIEMEEASRLKTKGVKKKMADKLEDQDTKVITTLEEANKTLQTQVQTLLEEKSKREKEKIKEEVNGLIENERLSPGLRERVLRLAEALKGKTINLEENGIKKPLALDSEFLDILKAQKKINLGEVFGAQSSELEGDEMITPAEVKAFEEGELSKLLKEGKVKFDHQAHLYWVAKKK